MGIREDLREALSSRDSFESFRNRIAAEGPSEVTTTEALLEIREILDGVGERLERLLEADPLNSTLHEWCYGYWSYRRDDERAQLHDYILRALVESIAISGDGRSKETAFVVRSVGDEYRIIQGCGLRVVRQELQLPEGKPYDVLVCTDGEREWPVWFDISLFYGAGQAGGRKRHRAPIATRFGLSNPCPACGSGSVARIVYGEPDLTEGLSHEISNGEAFVAGCAVRPETWHCNACENDWAAAADGHNN